MNQADFRINGVILAGGKGSRMNYQDKPLLQLGNKRVIDWILQCAAPQVKKLSLNVNRNAHEYVSLGLPIVTDIDSSDAGPLAGIYAALHWNIASDPSCTHLACFPGDVPWFDPHIVERMQSLMAREGTQIGWLQTNLQRQPLFSVWDLRLAPALGKALQEGVYSPMRFIMSQAHSLLIDTDIAPGHYVNLNTPEDLAAARDLANRTE